MSANGGAGNDFRAASDLRHWPSALTGLDPGDSPAGPRGPGMPGAARADDGRAVTSARRAGRDREPGSGFVNAATAALGLEAAGLLYVSFAAQYAYILSEKPGERAASLIEAGMLDGGQIILSFLALGLARQGKPARTERALIMVCAALAAVMNYAAAVTTSWRSVLVYVLAPVFLAIITDRVIAVVRRHVLGDEETSAWLALGRALRAAAKAAGLVLLYSLRFVLDRKATFDGLRQMVLDAAPVPEPEPAALPAPEVPAIAPAPVAGPAGLDGPAGKAQPPQAAAPPQRAGNRAAPRGQTRAAQPGGRDGPAARRQRNGSRAAGRRAPVTYEAVAAHYADQLAAGQVPSGKDIRAQFRIGSGKAGEFHGRLAAAAAARSSG
jgi:hypothetical protein